MYALRMFVFAMAGTSAFRVATPTRQLTARFADKINTKIDLEVAKVVTIDEVVTGKKKVYCRCWLSGTFPYVASDALIDRRLCDGTHAKHNEETGDNVGPLIVKAAQAV